MGDQVDWRGVFDVGYCRPLVATRNSATAHSVSQRSGQVAGEFGHSLN